MTEEKKKWETKPNTGSAFKNRRKQKDTHPDYTGEMLITEPGLYWFNMWEKRTQSGDPWFSASLNRKEEREPTSHSTHEAAGKSEPAIDDDSIPF